MRITNEVARVLSGLVVCKQWAGITGAKSAQRFYTVVIEEKLDRKLYTEVNKVLEALGGKWSRKDKAHTFEKNPTETLDAVIESGEVTTEKEKGLDFFPTPRDLARELVALAGAKKGQTVLEPSAGIGNIAVAAMAAGGEVTAVEIDPDRALVLEDALKILRSGTYGTPTGLPSFSVRVGNFLDMDSATSLLKFDAVVMNPPFSKRQDLAHVRHAYRFVAPGGVLVAVMSAGVKFRQDRLATEFRALVESEGGEITDLPDESFRESGTGVRAVVVRIRKPARS